MQTDRMIAPFLNENEDWVRDSTLSSLGDTASTDLTLHSALGNQPTSLSMNIVNDYRILCLAF